MSERIEGKHYYAEIDERSGIPMWIVCRASDGHPIHRVSAEFWEAEAIRVSYVEPADATADHFIQQGRTEALAEVDEAAHELWSFDWINGETLQWGVDVDAVNCDPQFEINNPSLSSALFAANPKGDSNA